MMNHSPQCLGSVVRLAMFLICFVKGFGSGSLSDNGDIGDLISDYGPLSNIGVSDAQYWAQYWLPQTRTKFAISSQVSANYKKSEYTIHGLSYLQYCEIFCASKCREIQNTTKYQIRCQAAKFHQISNSTKYTAEYNQILWTTTHMLEMCLKTFQPQLRFKSQTTSNWRSSNQQLSLITNQM